MLGIAIAAIALTDTMFVDDSKTIPLSPTQKCGGVHTGETVFELSGKLPSGACLTPPAASISGEPLWGPLPEVCISNLPAINETAVVTVTYTHNSRLDITETKTQSYPKAYSTGWRASPGFEIVDSCDMTAKPFYPQVYPPRQPELKDYRYLTPTPLNSGESVTYTFEVRAVKEGTNYVAGVGYYEVDAHIFMYLDDEETMFDSEHRALYPELHPPPYQMSESEMAQAEEAEHLRQLAEAIKNPPPNTGRTLEGDERIGVVTMWVVKEGFTPEEAVEHLASLATPLDVDDIRRILTGAGFSEDEINSVLPTSGTYTAYPDGCVQMTSPSGASICVLEESVPKMEVLGFELAG